MRELWVDFAAVRDERKIAVLVAAITHVDMDELYQTLGDFALCSQILQTHDPERVLYVAVTRTINQQLFQEPLGQLLLANQRIRLLVFDVETERIVEWPQI